MQHNPVKLTPEVEKRLLDALEAGNHVEVAVQYAGISRRTFYLWLKWGREGDNPRLREFYEAVQKARVGAEVRAVAHLVQAMETDWRAALAFLTHKFPRRWGNRRSSRTGNGFRRKSKSPSSFNLQPSSFRPKPTPSQIDRLQQALDEAFALDTNRKDMPE